MGQKLASSRPISVLLRPCPCPRTQPSLSPTSKRVCGHVHRGWGAQWRVGSNYHRRTGGQLLPRVHGLLLSGDPPANGRLVAAVYAVPRRLMNLETYRGR